MKFVLLFIGVIAMGLGGLWSLQGFGIVHIEPILCVADCEAIEGNSPLWATVGLAVLLAGAGAIALAVRMQRGTNRPSG